MKTPPYRLDYTQSAIDVYEHAKWKGYKFKRARNLDSWLAYGWSLLFKRTMTDYDIKNLTAFVKKRQHIQLKQKSNIALDTNDRTALKHTYIGQDGYIYMFKHIPMPDCKNPKETKRLEQMLEEAKVKREQREEDDLKLMAQRAYIKNYYTLQGTKLIKK